MAFWVLSGGGPPDMPGSDNIISHSNNHNNVFPQQHVHLGHDQDETPYVYRPKRPVEYQHPMPGDAAHDFDGAMMKRARINDWAHHQMLAAHDKPPSRHSYQGPGRGGSSPGRNLAFYVIREGSHSTPPEHIYNRPRPASPAPTATPTPKLTSTSMERTASGLSVSSDPSIYKTVEAASEPSASDLDAAAFVLKNIASSHRHSQPSRILHGLIHPSSGPHHPEFTIDNEALTNLFHAANGLFFGSRLSRRVRWDWTSEEDGHAQYDGHIIGTTALRRCEALGGYETLIVLSSPILRDTRYNRRLLIATFLHEMIHSYLFVACGRKAGRDGGHTPGFRSIAEAIDAWVGDPGVLRLGEMQADLDQFCERGHRHDRDFEADARRPGGWQWYGREGFGGMQGASERGWDDVYAR